MEHEREPQTQWQVFDRWQDHDDWGELPTQDLKKHRRHPWVASRDVV